MKARGFSNIIAIVLIIVIAISLATTLYFVVQKFTVGSHVLAQLNGEATYENNREEIVASLSIVSYANVIYKINYIKLFMTLSNGSQEYVTLTEQNGKWVATVSGVDTINSNSFIVVPSNISSINAGSSLNYDIYFTSNGTPIMYIIAFISVKSNNLISDTFNSNSLQLLS